MGELAFKSAVELAALVRSRKVGALELLDHYLARIARYNPKLNAVIVLRADWARERAKLADAALARGEVWGPLHGLPMTVKESYQVTGLATTWGHTAFRDNVAREDAVVVERLQAAGAIVFGKTNVPYLLQDFQSYNAIYGTTNNPWDVTRIPGGSSGGSAAALAAGLTGLETGSDIGGSIRNPSHFCGVFGHKPTHNVVPMRGHSLGGLSFADISVVGPLARAAEDLALYMDCVAGADLWHAPGWTLTLPPPKSSRLKDWRVAVWLDHPISPVDRAVGERIQRAADALAKAGATVSDTARPEIDWNGAWSLYLQLLHGVMGWRMPQADFDRLAARATALAPDDTSFPALEARGATQRHRDWLVANEQRFQMRLAWRRFFESWDVLLCPISPTTAFPHDQSDSQNDRRITVNGKSAPYLNQLFWAGITGAVYLPSTVLPLGPAADGLPAGAQLVGPEYGDRSTIELARLLARETGGFTAPKGYA
jgi:amidase